MSILRNKISVFIITLGLIFISIAPVLSIGDNSGVSEVQFASKDGFSLTGSLYLPKNKSLKNKVPLVILLHSLGKTRIDWEDFPIKIKNMGAAVLVMDLRGHGKSILDKKNKRKYWQNFSDKEFQKFPDDVDAAIKYIKQQYPDININKTGIIGADVGANAAIVGASRYSQYVKTLILLSPTTDFKGIETRIPMVAYGAHPVLIFVSRGDRFSYIGSSELIKYAQGIKQLKVYPSGGNGMRLLEFQPETQKLMIDWLGKYLIAGSIK